MATELAEGGLHELARLAGQAVRALDVETRLPRR